MAKHSKGKHGKPKSAAGFPFGKKGDKDAAKKAEERENPSEGEAGEAAGAGAGAAGAGAGAGAPGMGAHAAGPGGAGASAGGSAADASATDAGAANAGAAGSADGAADAGAANASATDDSNPAADATGEASQEAQQPEGPAEDGFKPAAMVIEKKQRDKKKIARRVGITVLSVVGVVAAVYFVGVAVFSTRFMPNTHIGSIDLSFKTPEEVQSDFDTKVGDYTIKVKGNGLNISFTSADAGLAIDSVGMTETISAGQDPWKWPLEVFEDRDMAHAMTDSLSATTLSDVVRAAVDEVNATAKDPIDAYVDYDPDIKAFDIVPEVPGTKLDYDKVFEDILVGAMSLEDQVVILDDDLIEPAVYSDDRRLVSALGEANDLIKSNLTLMMGGSEACKVTPDDIHVWVSVTPEFTAVLDDAAMTAWAADLASQFNTVGSTRNYTRADGKNITVSGGDYGWKIDKDALTASLIEAIRGGVSGNIDIPVLQGGSGYSGVGGRDWGTRYVDVDIAEQHARLYGDDGSIIWESAIVSGATSGGRATPYGVYDLNLKGRNVTLTGRDSAGNITYETPVAYWMPFIANSIGFHDATWQSSFGGNRYRTGHGSHGCINLPLSKAQDLYGVIKVGDVVVVHG